MAKKLSEFSSAFLISAISYGILFYLNDWLTSSLAFGLGVNWIYLPAGLRLFLTLVFALPGAIGIVAASFLICWFGNFPHDLTTCLGVGLISGFAPYMPRVFSLRFLRYGDSHLQKSTKKDACAKRAPGMMKVREKVIPKVVNMK